PDTTVEQQFPSFAQTEAGKSAYFVIRTAEKEPELVQAALGRLLSDAQAKSLLRRTYIDFTGNVEDRLGQINFFDQDPNDPNFKRSEHRTTGSPLFIKSLLTKELLRSFGITDKRDLPGFDVRGEGTSTPDGQYQTLTIKLEKTPTAEQRAAFENALRSTVTS